MCVEANSPFVTQKNIRIGYLSRLKRHQTILGGSHSLRSMGWYFIFKSVKTGKLSDHLRQLARCFIKILISLIFTFEPIHEDRFLLSANLRKLGEEEKCWRIRPVVSSIKSLLTITFFFITPFFCTHLFFKFS